MHFLANVPAKLKEIIDNWNTRLSSARAAKIDNLDATVSSRAPASTALSNTVWTDARAAALDSLRTPAKINDVGFFNTLSGYVFSPDAAAQYFYISTVAGGAWQPFYSRSGSGAVTLYCGQFSIGAGNSISVRLVIDGVEIWSASYTNSGTVGTYVWFAPIGMSGVAGSSTAYYKVAGSVSLVNYSSSVSLEYMGAPISGGVYYKELWY